MTVTLKSIALAAFHFPLERPEVPAVEYESRLSALYNAAQVDWVLVYADREHAGNLTFLINFDPRFEEAVLLLGPKKKRFLITGNEGMGYVPIIPVPIEAVLCQTLSLPGQPRDTAPRLGDVLQQCGIKAGEKIGMLGWKYIEPFEGDNSEAPAFIPAFFVDVCRKVVGAQGSVKDITSLLMHPEKGQRVINSASQIAVFEWAARACSASVFSIVKSARPGMSEMEAISHMHYHGQPLSIHPILISGKGELNGLRSAGARLLEYGDAISTGIGYWGSLTCRAGLLLGEVDDSFFNQVAAPYFGVITAWYQAMHLGATGGEIYQSAVKAFGERPFHSALNPGHLISYEEWLHSPIQPGSQHKIKSGMIFQCDIIPTPLPHGQVMNCEDTLAIADQKLRAEIKTLYPAMWRRIQDRRELMIEQLGINLADEVLPLSDGAACLPPFWLASHLICTNK